MNIKLSKEQKIEIRDNRTLFAIMRNILRRESKVDQDREHFWTVAFNNAKRVLNIELVSMGSYKNTIAEPMEVFSIPLQKRAACIIIVHNHPSGTLSPSQQDKELTNLLIQCGKILHVEVYDHLIITDKDYYSFRESGMLEELERSTKYVPDLILQQRLEKQLANTMEQGVKKGATQKALAMAAVMKAKGYKVKEIMELTGLSRKDIAGIKQLQS